MKTLFNYFFEELSKENVKKLEEYVTNDNFDDYYKLVKRHASKNGVDKKTFEDFFKRHGIAELNWGRNNDAVKQFTHLFAEYDNLDKLNEIIQNDGVISVNDVEESANIFTKYCKGFEEEAKTIASWTNSTSANAGPCEMLLKFILKEGRTFKSGDVGILGKKEEEMEVKAGTLKGKTASGGHAAGQKGNIRKAWSIYWYLDHNLFNKDTDNSEADKLQYFQNEKVGFKDFNQKLIDNNLLDDPRNISDKIVEALEFQYNFISNSKGAKSELKTENDLKDAAFEQLKSYITKDGISSNKALINVVGCVQLYLYSQVEQFDYFFVVMIDKNIDNESAANGFYFFAKDCKNDKSVLLDFNKVLSYLEFGQLDSTTSSQGRTGKIKIIKK